jgi:hypothetical protein
MKIFEGIHSAVGEAVRTDHLGHLGHKVDHKDDKDSFQMR